MKYEVMIQPLPAVYVEEKDEYVFVHICGETCYFYS